MSWVDAPHRPNDARHAHGAGTLMYRSSVYLKSCEVGFCRTPWRPDESCRPRLSKTVRVISGNPISTLDNRSLRQQMTSTHDNLGLMVHSMGGRGPPLQRKKTLSKDRKPYAVMVVSAGGVSASAHDPRGTCAPREAPPPRPALPTRLRWHPPTRRRSRRVRLLGDVERGARRLRSLLPSTTTPRLPPSAPSLELSEAAF